MEKNERRLKFDKQQITTRWKLLRFTDKSFNFLLVKPNQTPPRRSKLISRLHDPTVLIFIFALILFDAFQLAVACKLTAVVFFFLDCLLHRRSRRMSQDITHSRSTENLTVPYFRYVSCWLNFVTTWNGRRIASIANIRVKISSAVGNF